MNKSDLQITINVPQLSPELSEAVAATHEAFSRAGVSVAEAGAALAAVAPHFYKAWDEAISDLQQHIELLSLEKQEAARQLDKLGISLTDYWEKLEERKAQQRAQLILLLVFVLLTLLVGLL